MTPPPGTFARMLFEGMPVRVVPALERHTIAWGGGYIFVDSMATLRNAIASYNRRKRRAEARRGCRGRRGARPIVPQLVLQLSGHVPNGFAATLCLSVGRAAGSGS